MEEAQTIPSPLCLWKVGILWMATLGFTSSMDAVITSLENIDLLTAATLPKLTVDDVSLYIYFSKLQFMTTETPDTEGKDRKGALHSAVWQPFWYTQVYSCKFYNEMFYFLIPRSSFGSNTVAFQSGKRKEQPLSWKEWEKHQTT